MDTVGVTTVAGFRGPRRHTIPGRSSAAHHVTFDTSGEMTRDVIRLAVGGDLHRDDSLTRQLVTAASGRDVASGSGDAGPTRCRSIHPAPRARVRNGRAPSRARGNQRAGTTPTARPDPMIGNRAPSRHSGRTPGCGHGRLPRQGGRPARFESPRCPPGRTSAAIRATSG